MNPATRAGALRRWDDTLTLRSVESARRGACQIIGGAAIAVVSVTNSRYHLLGGSATTTTADPAAVDSRFPIFSMWMG